MLFKCLKIMLHLSYETKRVPGIHRSFAITKFNRHSSLGLTLGSEKDALNKCLQYLKGFPTGSMNGYKLNREAESYATKTMTF